jgi:hypothetical protein
MPSCLWGALPQVCDLPPGQAAISTFPKYGAGMRRTARPARRTLSIRIDGHVKTAFEVPVAELLNMKREQITADLHCVAGWSCRGLRWDGVGFGSFYETTIAPRIRADMRLSHLLFLGADGYKATLLLEDACAEDVMLADRLGGAPLNVSQLRRHQGGRPLGWDSAIPVSVVSGTPQMEPFRRGHERYAVRPSMDATTAVVIGVAIGAAGAILGGILGAWFIAHRDDRRRRREHEAAVRASLHELAGNLATFATANAQGSPRHLAVSRSAYDGLLVTLFSAELPERIATHLGSAYGRLTLMEKLPDASWDLMHQAQPELERAQRELMDYAKTKLGMKF